MASVSGPSSSSAFQQTVDAIAANAPLPDQQEPIRTADLSCSEPSEDRLRTILTALGTNTTLTALNLSGNGLGSFPGVEKGSLDHLLKHKSITSLDLSNNKLGAGSHSLAEMFIRSSTIKSLNLSYNQLDRQMMIAFGEDALTGSTLTSLNLDNNPLEETVGWIAGRLAQNTRLTSLSLRSCGFAFSGLRRIDICLETNRALRHVLLDSPLVYSNEEETSALSRMGAAPGGVIGELISTEIPALCRRIVERTLENERRYNEVLNLQERSFRNLVKPVYIQLSSASKRAVELQIWQNFNYPYDPGSQFGKNNVFTSFEKFVASVKGAGVDMAAELSAFYSQPKHNPRGIDLAIMRDWAAFTFKK
ncbi:MAG: hypothetical protein V4492_08070 [Chlamydiota bacterium]